MLDDLDQSAPTSAEVPTAVPTKPRILCPGTQYVMGGDAHIETICVGNDEFTKQVVGVLAEAREVYRHHDVAGVVRAADSGTVFEPLTKEFVRGLVDKHATLVRTKVTKSEEGLTIQERAVATSADLGGLVLDRLQRDERIRVLKYVCDWPCYLTSWTPIQPGYNSGGYFYSEPLDLQVVSRFGRDGRRLTPEKIRAHLNDLVVDFPFAGQTDRENFLGLLLTFLLRPALETVPLFLVQASRERTGKSKLLQEVVGPTIFGRRLISTTYKPDETEFEKGLSGILTTGRPYVLYDNCEAEVGGAMLCSLLTSTSIAERLLGTTNSTVLENNLVFMATANNCTIHKDMNGRMCVIDLVPTSPQPERRTDFVHPDIFAYALERRAKTLVMLRSMVENWRDAGYPAGKLAMGSFERWSRTVGGIMEVNGFTEWMRNWALKPSSTDSELAEVLEIWWRRAQEQANQARFRWNGSSSTIELKVLLEVIKGTEFQARVLADKSHAPDSAKGHAVGIALAKLLGRPVQVGDVVLTVSRFGVRRPALYTVRLHGTP